MPTRQISVDKNELYVLIKEAVREVLHEEALEFFFKNISSVSKEEMNLKYPEVIGIKNLEIAI